MLEIILTTLPLSIAAAVSPTSLLLLLAILMAKEGQVRNGMAYIGGGLLAYTGILVTVLFSYNSAASLSKPPHNLLHGTVDLVLALVALCILVYLLNKGKSAGPKKPAKLPQGILAYVMFGASMRVASANTIPPFISAVKAVAGAELAGAAEAVALSAVVLVTMLPLIAPFVLFLFNQEKALALLTPVGDFLTKHRIAIVCAILAVVTVQLAMHGYARVMAG